MSKILLYIAAPLFIIAVLILCVELCAKDRKWLEQEYSKLDINDYTGMSTDDMCDAYMHMVDFMSGNVDTMDIEVTVDGEKMLMYNEEEAFHMVDVRRLYSKVTVAKYCSFGLAAVAVVIAIVVEKKNSLRQISKAYLIAFACILAAFLTIGLWAVIDFDSFWIVFHMVFLDLESSTFDPMYSRMIRICPAELFQDLVIRIFAWGLGICAGFAAIAGGYYIAARDGKVK